MLNKIVAPTKLPRKAQRILRDLHLVLRAGTAQTVQGVAFISSLSIALALAARPR